MAAHPEQTHPLLPLNERLRGHSWLLRYDPRYIMAALAHTGREAKMQFLLGILLFVVVVGLIDRWVPWPKPRKQGTKQ